MKKRYISLLLVLVLTLSIFTGCGPKEATGKGDGKLVEIIDMADRTVMVPQNVEKVLATSAVGTILVYSLNPDKMVGWNYELREGEKQYINEKYHDLPNMGGAGKEPLNLEEVLKVDPDVLVAMTTIDDTNISEIEELQEKLDKPIIMIDSDIETLNKSYEILGRVMGEEKKAKELGDYCKTTLGDIEENSKKITEDMKVGIYYAEGPAGLETEPSNSWHGQVIDMIGGRNVAEVELKEDSGKSEVNMEQLLKWDPDIIISWDDERGGYYSGILEDPAWKDIKAVKNGEVYEIPNRPFNWFDRPPSVNRILGLRWLGNLLYPEIYDYDMKEEVVEFYEKFYHYELTDEELEDLTKNTLRQ